MGRGGSGAKRDSPAHVRDLSSFSFLSVGYGRLSLIFFLMTMGCERLFLISFSFLTVGYVRDFLSFLSLF